MPTEKEFEDRFWKALKSDMTMMIGLDRVEDGHSKPTRLALTAVAWGEPVPRTEAAARKIAAKGHRLLKLYKRRRRNGGLRGQPCFPPCPP